MDWLQSLLEHPALAWLAVAIVLALLELLSFDLFFATLAGGALAGALVAAVGGGLVPQVLVAVAEAVICAVTLRPALLRRLRMPATASTGVAALVHRRALVLSDVTDRSGLVKLAGETWTARTRTPGEVLAEGSDVVVLAIDGATAVVGPVVPAVDADPSDEAGAPSAPLPGREPHQQEENR